MGLQPLSFLSLQIETTMEIVMDIENMETTKSWIEMEGKGRLKMEGAGRMGSKVKKWKERGEREA
jgi:hypothetical protein